MKRNRKRLTHCKVGHPLEGQNVIVFSNGDRRCRLCRNAYRKTYLASRRGEPVTAADIDRFMGRVDQLGPNGCWEWLGARDRDGYGLFTHAAYPCKAHRFSYSNFVGAVDDKLVLDHTCRNPGCVNPAHLEQVTNQENILRGEGLAAQNARKTHCVNGHEFNEANTRTLPNGRRECRECRRRITRESNLRRRKLKEGESH